MADNNLIFLENLEWFDESGNELVHRLPEKGSAEIKYGAQLVSVHKQPISERPGLKKIFHFLLSPKFTDLMRNTRSKMLKHLI